MGGSRGPHHESGGEPRSEGQNCPLYVPPSLRLHVLPLSPPACAPCSSSDIVATLVSLSQCASQTRAHIETHRDERDGRGGNGCDTGAAIFCVHCSRPPVSHSQSYFHLYRAHPVSISCLPYSLPNSEHPAPARRPMPTAETAPPPPPPPYVYAPPPPAPTPVPASTREQMHPQPQHQPQPQPRPQAHPQPVQLQAPQPMHAQAQREPSPAPKLVWLHRPLNHHREPSADASRPLQIIPLAEQRA